MSEEFNEVMVTAVKNQEQAAELVEKLFAVAQPSAVYGEPVTAEGHTVITASEVSVGMGFGYGIGGGSGGARRRQRESRYLPIVVPRKPVSSWGILLGQRLLQ